MRAFISIEFPEEIKDELIRIQQKLLDLDLFSGKLIKRENLHLTLKFLGKVDDKKILLVEDRLKKLDFNNFKVKLGNLGFFGDKFIRVIWVSLEDGELIDLQNAVEGLLDGLFEKGEKFSSHITLFRPKKIRKNSKFVEKLEKIEFDKKEFIVDKIFLRESLLSKRGPEYSDVLVVNSA